MKDKITGSFEGVYFRSIDFYGRIVIPVSFRTVLKFSDSNVIIIAKADKSLVAFTFEEWEKVKKAILSAVNKSEVMTKFGKHFFDNAKECSVDKKGRILIPHTLRRYAKLEKQIVFVGLLSQFEILPLRTWRKIPKEIKNAVDSKELISLWSINRKK